jgi:hypothetical protein
MCSVQDAVRSVTQARMRRRGMCYADLGKKIWEGGELCEVAEDAIVSELGTLAVVT